MFLKQIPKLLSGSNWTFRVASIAATRPSVCNSNVNVKNSAKKTRIYNIYSTNVLNSRFIVFRALYLLVGIFKITANVLHYSEVNSIDFS